MHSKEEVINLINNHLKKQIQIFEEKTNVLINSKIKLIENTFSDKINKEIKKFKKDELNRELDEIKNEFKEELNSAYENTVKNLKTNIGEIKKETENYINENKDQVESKTSISLFQINGVENQAIEQINKLLEFSIDSINSTEKTSLNNLNKYKISLEEEFEEIKNSYKNSINENKKTTIEEIEKKKDGIMKNFNIAYISSVQSLSDTKDELVMKFNNIIDDTKKSLKLYKEQLEGELENKKSILIKTIDFDKQSVLNELIKRKDIFLTELSQKRFDEITRLNNKATTIFEDLTLGIDGFEEELEVFKRNKINEFTQYVLSVFEEYKKIIKQISNTLTESFNVNSEEKHNSLQKKYTDYLQELLNSFTGHIESLNLKKIEITNHLGSDSNSGLWKRIVDNISELTQSKLEYLTENTSSMKEEINTLTSLKKQEINTLRDDVISNIGTTNESDYKNNPSLRKSAINAINSIKESALDSIENKKNSSLQTLETFKEETKVEVLNKSIEGVNNLINSIKAQKYYVVLPKGEKHIILPKSFLTRGDLLVALNGNILTENTHYTFDVSSKTFILNQSLNYDSELYFFEQFPVKGDHSLNFIINGRKLGVKRESDLEYQFTEDLGVPGPAGPKGDPGPSITNIVHLNGNNFRMFFGNNNHLDFEVPTIIGPKGATGDKGDIGLSGPQGQTGERGVGIENIQLIENNRIQINYGDNQVFTFEVPTVKGEKGEPGLDGSPGETPIVTLNQENYKLNINGFDVGESLKPTASDLTDLRLPLNQIDNLNSLKINWNQINNVPDIEWNNINNKPSSFIPITHTHDWSQVQNKPSFNSSINSEVENEIATPKAVKTSYDKAVEALNFASSKFNETSDLIKRKEDNIEKKSGFNLEKSSAVDSDKEDQIATSKAVKTVYDLASSKQSPATTLADYGITNFKVELLGENINLNDIKTPGIYGQDNWRWSTTDNNYPEENKTGALTVYNIGNDCLQEYRIKNVNLIYRRSFESDRWSNWEKVGNDSVPIGSIVSFPKEVTNPKGFLKCDGTVFNQQTYPDLYRALGNKNKLPNLQGSDVGMTAYFTADSIPDGWIAFDTIRSVVTQQTYPELYQHLMAKYGSISDVPLVEDRFIRNAGGGLTIGQKQDDEIKAHTHKFITFHDNNSENTSLYGEGFEIEEKTNRQTVDTWHDSGTDNNGWIKPTDTSKYATGGTETRPKSIAFNFCIKAKNTFHDVIFWIKAFGEVTNVGIMDASKLSQDIQDKVSKSGDNITGDLIIKGHRAITLKEMAQSLGLEYGGDISEVGEKEVEKAYWSEENKKLYKCIKSTAVITPNEEEFIAIDNNSILNRLNNLFKTEILLNTKVTTGDFELSKDFNNYKMLIFMLTSDNDGHMSQNILFTEFIELNQDMELSTIYNLSWAGKFLTYKNFKTRYQNCAIHKVIGVKF